MKYNIVIVNITLLLVLIIGNIYGEYIYSFNALISGHRVYFSENFDY